LKNGASHLSSNLKEHYSTLLVWDMVNGRYSSTSYFSFWTCAYGHLGTLKTLNGHSNYI